MQSPALHWATRQSDINGPGPHFGLKLKPANFAFFHFIGGGQTLFYFVGPFAKGGAIFFTHFAQQRHGFIECAFAAFCAVIFALPSD